MHNTVPPCQVTSTHVDCIYSNHRQQAENRDEFKSLFKGDRCTLYPSVCGRWGKSNFHAWKYFPTKEVACIKCNKVGQLAIVCRRQAVHMLENEQLQQDSIFLREVQIVVCGCKSEVHLSGEAVPFKLYTRGSYCNTYQHVQLQQRWSPTSYKDKTVWA